MKIKKIIYSVIIISICVVLVQVYLHSKYEMEFKNQLSYNLNNAIEKFENLEDDNNDFNYKSAVSSYYATLVSLKEIQCLYKQELDYINEMEILYSTLLSEKNITKKKALEIKKILITIKKDYKNKSQLFELIKRINNDFKH